VKSLATARMMSHIADAVVSYEHEASLQYLGAERVREVCQRGFDFMEGTFSWDIPDMELIVCGDIAIQWGLNMMRFDRKWRPRSRELVSWDAGIPEDRRQVADDSSARLVSI